MDSKSLILAEDDVMLASLLKYRLEKEGFSVTLCQDGKKVKEELEAQLPDLIVSDIMMPYFSGIELTDYLRNQLNSQIPIILISAASNDENVVSAFELGANDFISKPVSPSELLVRVKRELIRKR
ncbi:response regulator [Croceivirga radicis]|uniref:Response regulator n=1 Tax=Croceivirga radicis TaxID=1929488 RepID=A0A1V6LRP7_9FLAO|nr:response regulator transcription factor [Croceivirga radicis]OQD42871.1 response regulator [Croceivirga radicis]